MTEHFPAILVMTPILGSVLIMLIRNDRANWLLAVLSSFSVVFCSIALYMKISVNGPISYAMGGWEPPVGIEYRIDELNALFIVMISIASFAIILLSLIHI